MEAYADVNGIEKRWHLFYTREPYSMDANIDLQVIFVYIGNLLLLFLISYC